MRRRESEERATTTRSMGLIVASFVAALSPLSPLVVVAVETRDATLMSTPIWHSARAAVSRWRNAFVSTSRGERKRGSAKTNLRNKRKKRKKQVLFLFDFTFLLSLLDLDAC